GGSRRHLRARARLPGPLRLPPESGGRAGGRRISGFLFLPAPLFCSNASALMGDILHQLGIDSPKLIAQIIIFGIVYMVLKKLAFGPVTEMLETRQRRIAEGEDNLKKIKENLSSAEAQAAASLNKANTEAERLVKEAK